MAGKDKDFIVGPARGKRAWRCPYCGDWFTDGETRCADCDYDLIKDEPIKRTEVWIKRIVDKGHATVVSRTSRFTELRYRNGIHKMVEVRR